MPRITITEPGKNPQPYRFDLATELVKIGRRSENEIVVTCGSASGRHAEMKRVPGGFELRDLGSTNGVLKDGNRIDIVRLADGDKLLLGDIAFEFQLSEDELAILVKEGLRPMETEASRKDDEDEMPARKDERPPRQEERRTRSNESPPRVDWEDDTDDDDTSTSSKKWFVLVFLLLCLIAFYQGVSLRHKNDDARMLNEISVNGGATPRIAPEVTAPAEPVDDVFAAPSPTESGDTAPTNVDSGEGDE